MQDFKLCPIFPRLGGLSHPFLFRPFFFQKGQYRVVSASCSPVPGMGLFPTFEVPIFPDIIGTWTFFLVSLKPIYFLNRSRRIPRVCLPHPPLIIRFRFFFSFSVPGPTTEHGTIAPPLTRFRNSIPSGDGPLVFFFFPQTFFGSILSTWAKIAGAPQQNLFPVSPHPFPKSCPCFRSS